MISPGAIGPVAPLAAFVTPAMIGSGVVTVRLTLINIVAGLLVPITVTPTIPVYEPLARPDGFTVTARLAGVVPPVGLTANQLPPVAVAVKGTGELLDRLTD